MAAGASSRMLALCWAGLGWKEGKGLVSGGVAGMQAGGGSSVRSSWSEASPEMFSEDS